MTALRKKARQVEETVFKSTLFREDGWAASALLVVDHVTPSVSKVCIQVSMGVAGANKATHEITRVEELDNLIEALTTLRETYQ